MFVRELVRAGLWPLSGRDILEVGCGSGYWLRQFAQWGASPERMTGIELLPHRAAEARQRCASGTTILEGDAARDRLPAASFDIVFQSTVLTSILERESRDALARQMRRLVRPGGAIVSYDFRYDNPRNPDVARLTVEDLRTLFPGAAMRVRSLTLAPFVARRIAPVSWLACHLLDAVPLFHTHVLAIIRSCPAAQ